MWTIAYLEVDTYSEVPLCAIFPPHAEHYAKTGLPVPSLSEFNTQETRQSVSEVACAADSAVDFSIK